MTRPNLDIDSWIILEGYRGSIAHGTYVPKGLGIDDKDIIGVAIPPLEYYFGLKQFEQKEMMQGEWDIVVYELKKYVRLLLQNNPNVLSLLWLQKNHYTRITPLGQKLIDNRSIFLSKQCYNTFCGYAYGQLYRMTHFDREKAYKGNSIGAKRKELVDKYGYDTKNAGHCIRIMKMGIELLTTGELQVMRPDSQYLIGIKEGKYRKDEIEAEYERLRKLMDEAFVRTSLPDKPDYDKVDKLLKSMLSEEFQVLGE